MNLFKWFKSLFVNDKDEEQKPQVYHYKEVKPKKRQRNKNTKGAFGKSPYQAF